MMTGTELISFTREYLHESVQDFWTPTKLLATLNVAQKRMALKMNKAASNVFVNSCTIPTISGTQNYILPNGTAYSAAKKCTGKINSIYHANELPMTKGDWRLFHQGGTGKPYQYVLMGNYLYLYPIPSAVYSLTLWYPYIPTTIVDSSAEIDFLEGFEPLIALEAARTSLVKDEADLSDIRMEFATFWEDFKDTFCGNRDDEPDSMQEDVNDPDD